MHTTAARRRPHLADRAAAPGERLKVAVLMGGVGHERDVSMVSGREVAKALLAEGHLVVAYELETDDERALDPLRVGFDVVFLALHGEYGEDGTIQAALARRGIAYTGSGPEASARAFDKAVAKRLLRRAGVPLAEHHLVSPPVGERELRHALRCCGEGRWVVKPTRMGSSVGVALCQGAAELRRALEEGARFRQPLLVEEFVPGRELTCGVLGEEALPVVEIASKRGFYDYRAKYDAGSGTEYLVEPEAVPLRVRDEVRRLALRCHKVLGCRDVSRVDFRYDPNAGRLAVLEVNTLPGMTPTSLFPKAAAAAGIPFGALLTRLCRMAVGVSA
ncbi:MAG: D-alanine--D-alanine ligase [Planctomycetota bacterium]|nr:MAG: D-alanine--D-alanine ligase [Planctomycetota bacterium]